MGHFVLFLYSCSSKILEMNVGLTFRTSAHTVMMLSLSAELLDEIKVRTDMASMFQYCI